MNFKYISLKNGFYNNNKIGSEITKPLCSRDNLLDSLLTQYISDFVKHIGDDGIKYKSTLNHNGNNYV